MIWRLTWELTLFYVLLAVVLFWPAGTFDWWGGWIYWGEMVVGGTAICWWLLVRDPRLLQERLAGAFQKNQVFWDKILTGLMQIGFIAWVIFMAFDRRWGFSPPMAREWNYVGAIFCPIFYLSCWAVFRENAFASPVVKMQEKQKVATTGVYRFVRHPMYAGGLFYFIGMPLLLGSWIGLAVVPFFVAFLLLRIPLEERMLKAELDGYEAYMARVRYRLVPGIW